MDLQGRGPWHRYSCKVCKKRVFLACLQHQTEVTERGGPPGPVTNAGSVRGRRIRLWKAGEIIPEEHFQRDSGWVHLLDLLIVQSAAQEQQASPRPVESTSR